MLRHGKGITADRARFQWHGIIIADIQLIARNTRGEAEIAFGLESELLLISRAVVAGETVTAMLRGQRSGFCACL